LAKHLPFRRQPTTLRIPHTPGIPRQSHSVSPQRHHASKVSNLLLSYAKWGSLIACAVAAVVSGGLMGIGHLSNRPDSADKGKRALIWSLGGVIVTACAIPMINTVFGASA
ncbi:hypothetical protein, partial [Streptacidiphilus cavernicola]